MGKRAECNDISVSAVDLQSDCWLTWKSRRQDNKSESTSLTQIESNRDASIVCAFESANCGLAHTITLYIYCDVDLNRKCVQESLRASASTNWLTLFICGFIWLMFYEILYNIQLMSSLVLWYTYTHDGCCGRESKRANQLLCLSVYRCAITMISSILEWQQQHHVHCAARINAPCENNFMFKFNTNTFSFDSYMLNSNQYLIIKLVSSLYHSLPPSPCIVTLLTLAAVAYKSISYFILFILRNPKKKEKKNNEKPIEFVQCGLSVSFSFHKDETLKA